MKRVLSIVLAVCLSAALLTGCGNKYKTALFNGKDLTEYITLKSYKGIEVDTSSDSYKTAFEKTEQTDAENNSLYKEVKKGKVKNGDTVNIDYKGKKDGVAFEGGTSEGYDLEIGSNSFIDGFEEGLIGVSVGKTVNLDLTFPEDYNSEELAGKDVVFTVKVNFIKTPKKPKEYFGDLGFKSLEEYEVDVKDRTIENLLVNAIAENTKVKDYPKDDVKFMAEEYKKSLEQAVQSQYGVSLKEYYTKNGQTDEQFEQTLLTEQINPFLESIMPYYLILQKEDIKITEEDINEKIKERIAESGDTSLTVEEVKKEHGIYSFEMLLVMDRALEVVKENAKIK